MKHEIEAIARAFSGHRFQAAYPYLDDDVSWTLVGERELTGKQGATGRVRGIGELSL